MIYIKDMDMPADCLACRISCKHESYLVTGRPKDCPLEEAKTGDLISRADALRELNGVCSNWEDDAKVAEIINALPSADAVSREVYEKHIQADERIIDSYRREFADVASAEAVQRWIPCEERLPDVDVEVLATTDWSEVLIAWHRKDGTWETDEYILATDEIIAWMPLPKPYKGGDSE